ncbi:MAG: hypothetical protein OEV74_18780 [Cyclobacteriaceae bacterium]|nr:hypothetical protein [Cyclobacteriaceae bacterium]MDH4298330.1 hypothetical protein [Cyclobacteriaceae bacterium]MDH5251179.1 hypothetical protein [Cyclobacteriaceae bacterium]
MKKYLIIILVLIITACKSNPPSIEIIAEDYVKLVLEIGQYDNAFVDAYFGPEEWKPTEPQSETLPLDNFVQRANTLISQCDALLVSDNLNLEIARINMLKKQLIAVRTKTEMIGGKTFPFDEEAKLLYDAVPPHFSVIHFNKLLVGLDSLLAGEGDLPKRYNNFMAEFIIPKEKLDTVFRVAIDESRRITKNYFKLPENENFVLEYVTDKVWSGYNYYQGNAQSLIQINTDFPIYISRAIDLGSHEGYPGHHIYMMLTEQNLVNTKGWMEYSVYPLFSPLSLIAEGSANYGIDVVFPGDQRIEFEKEHLFPIAGIDASKANMFYEIQDIRSKLDYAVNETARAYLNGDLSRENAIKQIEKYSLYTPEKAEQSLRFIETNRSYVINYNLGKDLVAKHVELLGGSYSNPEKRWEVFKELLSNPYSASTLKKE